MIACSVMINMRNGNSSSYLSVLISVLDYRKKCPTIL
jgi:hypothetical protein